MVVQPHCFETVKMLLLLDPMVNRHFVNALLPCTWPTLANSHR